MLMNLLGGSRLGIRRLGVAVFAAVVLVILAPTVARAATYTVGAVADTTPTACPSATATTCSLRQLVLYVEAHPSPPDTIDVPAGDYVLDSAYGEIALTADLTIVGAGANLTTIEEPVPSNRSTSGDRVFNVAAPSGGAAPTVTLSGLEIAGGDANSNNGYFGGDIVNSGTLTLDNDWVTNGFACSGGGVSNIGGTLSIERSLISANQSACVSGGDDSGGVQNYGEPGSPDLPAHLTIDDSTIAGNAARLGAGIYSWNDATNTALITNSTIADNAEQAEGGNVARGGGGGLGVATGSAQIENSILAGNTSTVSGSGAASNCAGTVNSLGHNLEDANTCQLTGPGDLPNANPALGPLQNNGGPTATFALAAGSPALAQVPAASCSATDQRGVARPTTSSCDIGAFELTAPSSAGAPTSTSTPTPTPAPAPSPQTSFTVGSQVPGGVTLAASTTDGSDVSRYQWTIGGGGGSIYCPVQEPIITLASSGAVSSNVTLNAISAGGQTLSSASSLIHISSRLQADRVPATTYTFHSTGECRGPITIPVPPLNPTPKKGAKPPMGSVGGAPPAGCTDDLDFGAVDIHGCLAEVPNPQDLPGGITAELGEAFCSASGLLVCLPQLEDGQGTSGLLGHRASAASVTAAQNRGVQALTQAGLPSYYSYTAVSLDGLDIVPQNGSPLLIVPAMDAIAGSSVVLALHGVQISPQAMPLTAFLPASGGLLANLTLANNVPLIGKLLPLTGAMSVFLEPAGTTLSDGTTCQYACAALHVNAAIPDEFSIGSDNLLTASGVIEADAVNGVNLSSLEVDLRQADFAGIGVQNAVFRYRAEDQLIYAAATLDLTPAIGDISGSIEFTGGGFREASLQYENGASPGIELGGPLPIFLTQLGGSINLHPTVISANATVSGGPAYFGCSLASVSGQATVQVSPFHLGLEGAGSLLCQNVADMHLEYGNGYLDIGASVHFSEPLVPVTFGASVNVGIDPSQGLFQFDGDVDACLSFLPGVCGDAEGVVSNVGIGVCADIWGLGHVGGGYVFPTSSHGGYPKLYFDTCDIDTFRSIHHFVRGTFRSVGNGGAAEATAPPQGFTLPSGKAIELVGFVGAGGAPKVRLVGPGGRTIDTPASGYVKTSSEMVVVDPKFTDTTYVFIRHPAGGTWTVEPEPGSVPITAIRAADSLPAPKLRGQLHSLGGGRERLTYTLHPLAGQTVTFQEQAGNGKRGFDVVGHAHGASGSLSFSPTLEMARARTLVAVVSQNGHVREDVVLAHFRAQTPPSLPAPRGLRAHRTDTAVSLSWRRVSGASGYLITVTAGKGKGAVHRALADTTTATLGGLPSASPLSVSVSARRSSPWAHAPGRAAVAHLAALKPVIHRVKLLRST
jgi:hypothetical protein